MKRLLPLALLTLVCQAADFRGSQFVGFSDFTQFKRDGATLTSPIIDPAIDWNEVIPSWNLAGFGEITIEMRIIHPDHTSRFYNLGNWTLSTNRTSVKDQNDDDGRVDTDTLVSKRRGGKLEARISFRNAHPDDLKFLSFAFGDNKAERKSLKPHRKFWGKVIDVPTRSQLDYPEGAKNWCSPTSSSMILDYWSKQLNRPELNITVREAAKCIYDPMWPGTGNWPFNTAYAGSFPGMRGYVSRLTDISELEEWIEAGIPIATSVSYNRLKGRGTAGSGHLIVCVGFDKLGDIVVNDPGTKLDNVRRTFPRDLFRQAWADSGNTVYIIYPEQWKIPPAEFDHWETR
jgi:hypothetical protein